MSLPAFFENGWLPPGHHEATWDDIIDRFAGNAGSQRRHVLVQLLQWRDDLRNRGLSGKLVLNGSFVSAKATPGDVDCVFVYDEPSEAILKADETARDLIDYIRCKAEGPGDVFAFPRSTVDKFPAFCRLDAFDLDKSGDPKGVVEVVI